MAYHDQISPNGLIGRPWVGSGPVSKSRRPTAYAICAPKPEKAKALQEERNPSPNWTLSQKPVLEGNVLLSALASRLVEGTLTFIDGIGRFRGFGGHRTVPVL